MSRNQSATIPANNRSRLADGSKLLPDLDGRSSWARAIRCFMADVEADAGGNLSTAQRAITRRAAALEYELMLLEQTFATAGDGATPEALDLYSRVAGNQRRLLEAVGLKRKPRDVTARVHAHLEAKAGAGSDSTPTSVVSGNGQE